MPLKLLQEITQETAESNGDLIGDKIANKIQKPQKHQHKLFQKQLKLKPVKPREKYMSSEERQEIIDGLRLIEQHK